VERVAKALHDVWLKTTTFFREFDETREGFEDEARVAIAAFREPVVRGETE
jgi:hypothetical protein